MLRSTFDKLLSALGALLAILLLIISGLAFWASSFAQGTVTSQLKDQNITMPTEAQFPKGQENCLKPYAGTPLDNGDKAKAYSDCYIKAHMNASSGGRTFSDVANAQMAAQKKDPNSAETKQLTALKESLFQGNSLRSMLLTAYAFGTIGRIALIGAITSLVGAILFGILSALGFSHAKKSGDAPLDHAHATTTVAPAHTQPATVAPTTSANPTYVDQAPDGTVNPGNGAHQA